MATGESIAGVDLGRLGEWMDAERLPRGAIQGCVRLGGGTQNILVKLERGGSTYVLRRPPLHKRDNSDETMRREARVLAALAGTDVPHPRLIRACGDESVLGAAFYLMQPVDGFNASTGLPEPHASDPRMRRQMGLELVDAVAALGRVDHVAVGLSDFGRAEGFLERQVGRWRAQLESYSKHEGYPGPEIPHLDQVAQWLTDNCPTSFRPGILHGDYHLANVMFEHHGPRIAAIVDWELATIGDPLLDLGWLLATWPDPEHPRELAIAAAGVDGLAGPTELVERYRRGSTRDLTAISWYAVLACYKLGIILEGTHARACAGKADRATGDLLHQTTLGLFARARRMVAA